MARAAAIDAAVVAGGDPGPLAGVPVALKDIVDQTGIVTTAGSSFLDLPAGADATVVTRLEAAGAVIIGRTGLHEFAYGFSSENDWWGPVRNPWDVDTSPGGSSGGSAVAVAAGVAPIGIGTDTGGSVRVPAALCGLVGLKVTHGRIPLSGVFPLAGSLDTIGTLTTTVQDAAIGYLALAGHDPSDPWSREQRIEPVSEVAVRSMSIGIPHPWTDRTIAPQQHRGFEATLDALRELGTQVEDFDEPAIDQNDLPLGSYAEVADVHREWFSDDPSRYGPTIRERLAAVFSLDDSAVASAAVWRACLTAAFETAFSRFDLLLTPTTAASSKTIRIDRIDIGAGPEPYRPVLSWFTPLVNQAGIPALAVPVETPDVAGLPPSIQLIGPRWSEAKLLGVGLALEAAGLVAHRTPPTFAR